MRGFFLCDPCLRPGLRPDPTCRQDHKLGGSNVTSAPYLRLRSLTHADRVLLYSLSNNRSGFRSVLVRRTMCT